MTVMPERWRILDHRCVLLMPKATRATFVERVPRGLDPAISEIYHNAGCTINFGTFPARPSLMLAGWRGIFRGDDGTVACELDWERA
jgi:hypothetical protein